MNAKLLNFDISKDNMSIVPDKTETEPVDELEDESEKILDLFLNEIDAFARTTMDKSNAEQEKFVAKWQEQLDNEPLSYTQEQQFETIERRILQITQEKINAENALAEFEKHAAQDIAYKEASIHDLNRRVNEYIKTTDLYIREIRLLKESLEKVKSTNSELESSNKILFAELKVDKIELESTQKRLLNELSQLHEKIEELQKKLDSATKDAEFSNRARVNAEIAHLQSQKALENSDLLNRSLQDELKSKESDIKVVQEKAQQNSASQMRKINELEGKLYQNGAQQSQKSQELEHKINHLEVELHKRTLEAEANIRDAHAAIDENRQLKKMVEKEQAINSSMAHLNKTLSEQAKAEKKELEAIKNRWQMESVALQKEIQELTSKLVDAQKQKELFIANKLNNTLQVKRDTYVDQSPGKLSKAALIVFPLIAIALMIYLLFNKYYYSPMVQKDLKGQVIALNAELENKSKYISAMTKERQQLATKLDELKQQVKLFQDNVGENLVKLEENQVSIIENQTNIAKSRQEEVKQLQMTTGVNIQSSATTEESPPPNPQPLIYQIKDSIYFDSGSSRLDQEGIFKVKRLAEIYKSSPYLSILLEGHTDDKMFRLPMFQQYSNNIELSIARAAEVSRLLVQYGVDTRQITIAGFGDIEPIAPNDNSEHREKNRRVDIKIGDGSNHKDN